MKQVTRKTFPDGQQRRGDVAKSTKRCYLCGRNELVPATTQLRHGPGCVWYCQTCELGMLQKHVSDDLQTYYDGQYRQRHGPKLNQPSSYRELFESYVNYQGSRVATLKPWLKPDMRLLEVGCSAGHFLYNVKGLVREVVGVDYDSGAARCAGEICNCTTYGGRLDEAGLAPASFDVVCAIQTMEHVEDPIGFAVTLGRYLKPGGTVYVEVPNVHDPLLSAYQNPHYRTFYFHEAHLFYFSQRSLLTVMERAGFTGAIQHRQDYNFFNHLHWVMLGQPQPTCHQGLGRPMLPVGEEVAPAFRKELEAWLETIDQQYKALLAKHHYTENIAFIGRLR